MSKNLVPSIGTAVRFGPGDVSLSKDQVTYMCRVTYDATAEQWVIASRYNPQTERWTSVTKSRRIGMIVFLNEKPDDTDKVIRITAIQPTGMGAYGDPTPIWDNE